MRGLPGNSVDRDRHIGFREVMEKEGKFDIVEIVGNWDDGTSQKATADAIAVHRKFDAIFTQGGSTGTVRAMIDAKHPFVPMAGEAENGYRKLIAQAFRRRPQGLVLRPVARASPRSRSRRRSRPSKATRCRS